jgi:hypothetical protein
LAEKGLSIVAAPAAAINSYCKTISEVKPVKWNPAVLGKLDFVWERRLAATSKP